MKLLMFQAKRFWFRSFSKTLESAEDVSVEQEVLDVAVIFVHAEATDEEQRDNVFPKMLKNIKWIANKRDLKSIALHSFTHLSENSATPEFAEALITEAAERLQKNGYTVVCTPFGYFCEWDLSVFGESLAKVFKSL
jgi:hypothetical protein